MSKASADLHGGWHSRAIETQYEGRGNGLAPWNEDKIKNCLRQLIQWASGKKLRKYKTALYCEKCQTLRAVVSASPQGFTSMARLQCEHERAVSVMTEPEYANLVTLASGLVGAA
jgi:hypothetical protein